MVNLVQHGESAVSPSVLNAVCAIPDHLACESHSKESSLQQLGLPLLNLFQGLYVGLGGGRGGSQTVEAYSRTERLRVVQLAALAGFVHSL